MLGTRVRANVRSREDEFWPVGDDELEYCFDGLMAFNSSSTEVDSIAENLMSDARQHLESGIDILFTLSLTQRGRSLKK